VRGQVPRATLPTVGELTERILGAVVDTHQLELSDGTARFVLVKQARATPA
jgi:hypothetical protein